MDTEREIQAILIYFLVLLVFPNADLLLPQPE